MTGSYNNMFYVYDWQEDVVTSIDANKNFPSGDMRTTPFAQKKRESEDAMDWNKKCLHVAQHPHEDLIAVGASNNLFLYSSNPEE